MSPLVNTDGQSLWFIICAGCFAVSPEKRKHVIHEFVLAISSFFIFVSDPGYELLHVRCDLQPSIPIHYETPCSKLTVHCFV